MTEDICNQSHGMDRTHAQCRVPPEEFQPSWPFLGPRASHPRTEISTSEIRIGMTICLTAFWKFQAVFIGS